MPIAVAIVGGDTNVRPKSQQPHCCPRFLSLPARVKYPQPTSLMRSHARDAPALALSMTLCSSFTSLAFSRVL